ncbi:MAG TPA: hemerythrin domain-containing protein [Methylomirabilota bacterium]|jgi:hemerythrin-like domain-containing protein|nr:hemerythrin domain-containing protein [Methylomirabilota bacterium]
MCSCRAATRRGVASHVGPATAELRHEHEAILRALAILERAGERLAAGQPLSEPALAELVELIRTFADRCHHGKEEDQLFPALRAKGVGEPLAVFLEDHVEGRGYLGTLSSPAPAAERAAAARRYVGLLRDHIQRENEVLFPMADDVLTADEHADLAKRYEEVERRVVGPGVHEKLLAALDRLEDAIPSGPEPMR